MKKGKKFVLYLFVATFVLAIFFGFGKIFAFNKEFEDKNIPEVTEELVDKLYSYLPKDNDFGVTSMYSPNYVTMQNINFSIMSKMAYENILNHDAFKLEVLTKEELAKINITGTPIHKIKRNDFFDSLKTIFGNAVKEHTNDFFINATTIGTYKDDYIYIYSKPNENLTNNNIIFKEKISYTVANNNETIMIYDYYLKCNKTDNLCYNDEKGTNLNKNIKYTSNMNVNNYKNDLKKYVHVFKYADGKYYWFSSEEA